MTNECFSFLELKYPFVSSWHVYVEKIFMWNDKTLKKKEKEQEN